MKKISLLAALFIALTAVASTAVAQQSREFNDYIVHYNALRTDLLPPQVAQGYGIQRSSSRALLNVTVMNKPESAGEAETAVPASIAVHAANLTGQRRDIRLREIRDAEGAIYYVGEFPVHNLETYQFKLEVLPEGEPEPLLVEFRQQFYTE
ncbi:MAG: DUF4426 domain-containing protein [Xanthomonadales bacterium]|nr:DUF4426 domain-containing protein [Xanthomonadales bacterium]